MSEEKKEVDASVEDDEIVIPKVEDDGKSEEEELQDKSEEKKDESKKEEEGFAKDGETVSANKLNQALRKAREAETEAADLKKQLEQGGGKKKEKKSEEDDEDEDDFELDDEDEEDSEKSKKKKLDIEAIIDSKVEPLKAQLAEREADDRKKQRTVFFKRHPEYLENKEKWQELLEELDNFNPNSKVPYYKQLVKAHRIIAPESGDDNDSVIEKKKAEMAADSASEKGGSQKATDRKSATDELADALGEKMPPGFTYTGKKK